MIVGIVGCGTMPYLAIVDNVEPIVVKTAKYAAKVDDIVVLELIKNISDELSEVRPLTWDQYTEFVNARLFQAKNFRISEEMNFTAKPDEIAVAASFFEQYMEFGKECRLYPFAVIGEKLDITISRLRTEVQRLTKDKYDYVPASAP